MYTYQHLKMYMIQQEDLQMQKEIHINMMDTGHGHILIIMNVMMKMV